jgi:hypothetical protein
MKHEIARFEWATLFDSQHAYADGYDYVICTCGWRSAPVRGSDKILIHSAHAERAEREERREANGNVEK